ncbi:mannose-1-phosphate guanylyltransferase [Enteropsectra breve]|nr:mannose-1-phosphate guanylyltransferase [Enteropsectra breve]
MIQINKNNRESIMNREVKKALILVGGWGTRLRPLTYTVPKPLVPFCNCPMLKYLIKKLADAGVEEIILAVNYFSELIMAECSKFESEFNIKIIVSKEDVPLGTAGPIALAEKYLENENFYVLNSDICCNVDLLAMKTAFLKSSCIGCLLVHQVEDPMKYGLVELEGNKITRFIEKPKTGAMLPTAPYNINAGVYIFSRSIFKYLQLREMSLETEVFPVLAKDGLLEAFALDGYWMDIGQIQDYLTGQRLYLNELSGSMENIQKSQKYTSPYLDVGKNVIIGANVSLGADIYLENCAIFDGVVIGNGSIIKNSIIGWDCVIGQHCNIDNVSALGKGVHIADALSIQALKIDPERKVYSSSMPY